MKGKIQIGVSIIRSFRTNLNYIRIDMVKRWGENGPTFEKKNRYRFNNNRFVLDCL